MTHSRSGEAATPHITDEELSELERLEKAATKGRWHWWTSNSWRRLRSEIGAGHVRTVIEPYTHRIDGHPDCIVSEADMALIAAMRNALPALLAALVSQRARILELEKQLAWHRYINEREWGAHTAGCPVCGIGADGKPLAYACQRNDCPTRPTANPIEV